MKEIMNWKRCLKEHIQKIEVDNDKISSIIRMCKARERIIKNAQIDDETASIVASDYYEIIKELLISLLQTHGMKSDNHECLISFFKDKYPNYEYECKMIHQLKNIRNRATYDGVFVKKDYVINNKLEFEHIIKLLYSILRKR